MIDLKELAEAADLQIKHLVHREIRDILIEIDEVGGKDAQHQLRDGGNDLTQAFMEWVRLDVEMPRRLNESV